MTHPFEKLLPVLEGIDVEISKLLPAGEIDIEGAEFGDFRVFKPGPFRAFENLVLARKSFTSLHALARLTIETERDHTEAIAVLTRRLIDLAAQTVWLTDYSAPSGFQVAEPGDPNTLLEDGDPEVWPSEQDRNGFACSVSAALDWIDAQALRSLLCDLKGQMATARKERDASEDVKRVESLDRSISMLRDQDRMVRSRLETLGARSRLRPDITSILTDRAADLVFFWGVESDVLHGGTAGRVLQRGAGSEPAIGMEPEPWRQAYLLTLASDCLARVAVRALDVLRIDWSSIEEYVKKTQSVFREVQQAHQPESIS